MEKLERALSKGKVLAGWTVPELKGLSQKDVMLSGRNVVVDYGLGMWAESSMSGEMEGKFGELSFKRAVWNVMMFSLFIIWCSFAVIILYEIRGDNMLMGDGLAIIFLGWVLLMLFWMQWKRNIEILRRSLKAVLGASLCMDVFVFCKGDKDEEGKERIDLGDETIKARAEAIGDLLASVNSIFMDGWFNVWFVLPLSFETAPEYDERLKGMIFARVRSTEERIKEHDEVLFMEINRRQVGIAERDILID